MSIPKIEPADYTAQLAAKVEQFKADFAAFALPEPAVYPSAPLHYRMRAEFRLWHQDERVDYAMFDAEEPKRPIIIDVFAAVSESIFDLMPRLRGAVTNPVLKNRLFQG